MFRNEAVATHAVRLLPSMKPCDRAKPESKAAALSHVVGKNSRSTTPAAGFATAASTVARSATPAPGPPYRAFISMTSATLRKRSDNSLGQTLEQLLPACSLAGCDLTNGFRVSELHVLDPHPQVVLVGSVRVCLHFGVHTARVRVTSASPETFGTFSALIHARPTARVPTSLLTRIMRRDLPSSLHSLTQVVLLAAPAATEVRSGVP